MSTHGDNVPVTVTAVLTGDNVTPPGLYPGPVVDGVQTYFGEFDSVPAGWEYRRSVGHGYWWIDGKRPPDRCLDGDLVVQCRQRQPRTERVPWHESVGRIAITPADREHARIIRVERKESGPFPWVWTDPPGPGNGGGIGFPARDGTVEVLVEDDQ